MGKQIGCYKCGKPGHKAFQCKTEKWINELFAYQPELKKKLLAVIAQNFVDTNDNVHYYRNTKEEESDYNTSPIKAINVTKIEKNFYLT